MSDRGKKNGPGVRDCERAKAKKNKGKSRRNMETEVKWFSHSSREDVWHMPLVVHRTDWTEGAKQGGGEDET